MDLTKRELLLEKRLADMSVASLPKPVVVPSISIKPKKANGSNLGLTPDQYDLRDLAYEARLNTISTNAIEQRLGWKPSKIKSDVTKEMIADYQFQQSKNVNKGIYIPATLDLDLDREVPPEVFKDLASELEDITARKLELIEENKAINEELLKVPEIESAIDEKEDAFLQDYTRFLLSIAGIELAQSIAGRMPTRRELDAVIPLLDGEERATLLRYLADYDKFDVERETLKREVSEARTQYDDNAFMIDGIEARSRQIRDDQREVGAVKAEIDQRNNQRRRLYVDQIKLMNSDRMDVEMLPGETKDEYEERLKEVGVTTPNEDAVQAAAKLFYTDVLREKLQEILSSDADISTFIKDMDGDERYIVVKSFPEFKKRFQDVVGKDKVGGLGVMSTLLELKDNLVATMSQEKIDKTTAEVARDAGVLESIPVDKDAMTLILEEVDRSRLLTDAMRRNLRRYATDKDTPEYSSKGGAPPGADKLQAYQDFRSRMRALYGETTREEPAAFPAPPTGAEQFRKLRDNIRARMDEIDALDAGGRDAALQGERESLDALSRARNMDELTTAARTYSVDLLQYSTRGSGIRRKHDKVAQFGRVDIHPQRLFYDNVLKVTKNGRSITGMPNTKVSDAFANVVMSVLNHKTPTMKDFTKMSVDERKLYDTLVIASGLQKVVETVGSGVKEDLKKRLALLEGEIEAGNTNPLLIKEARQVLHRMAQMKMVSRPRAVAHLKQLQAFQK